MRLLLDTNVFLWAAFEPERLSRIAAFALEDSDNQFVVSSVTPWELGIAVYKGRLDLESPLREFYAQQLAELAATELAIDVTHALAAGELPQSHRDPFDRMLAAQAIVEGLPILTNDRKIRDLGAEVVW